MLWFKMIDFVRDEVKFTSFKYISCYGSRQYDIIDIIVLYVFKYISCYGSSIIGKLSFITSSKFKYISCYGSSLIILQLQ